MNTMPLRWKIMFTLFGAMCGLIAVMGLAAQRDGSSGDLGFVVFMAILAFLLGVMPWLSLRGPIVRRLVAVILAIVLLGFAYMAFGDAITNPRDMDEFSRLVALAVGIFTGLLGIALSAQALGLITSRILSRGEASWEIDIQRTPPKTDESNRP